MLAKLLTIGWIMAFGSPGDAVPGPPAKQLVDYVGERSIFVNAGVPATIVFQFRMHEGYHIQSDAPPDENLIPTEFTLDGTVGILIREVRYPDPIDFHIEGVTEPFEVFDDTFDIVAVLEVHGGTPPGKYNLIGQLYYQACDKMSCLFPRILEVVVEVQVL